MYAFVTNAAYLPSTFQSLFFSSFRVARQIYSKRNCELKESTRLNSKQRERINFTNLKEHEGSRCIFAREIFSGARSKNDSRGNDFGRREALSQTRLHSTSSALAFMRPDEFSGAPVGIKPGSPAYVLHYRHRRRIATKLASNVSLRQAKPLLRDNWKTETGRKAWRKKNAKEEREEKRATERRRSSNGTRKIIVLQTKCSLKTDARLI